MSVEHDERLARVGLTAVIEPGDKALLGAVALHGPRAIWAAALGSNARLAGSADWLARLRARPAHADEPKEVLRRAGITGIRVLCPGDDEWPVAVNDLRDERPLCLFARGPARLDETARSVALVGARAATGYGAQVAADLGYGLAQRGWTIVSGAAYGIDAAAHKGALGAGGTTIAILACGVDRAYPRGNEMLIARIAEQGVVISEWPPGSAPFAHRFLTRNRLIAALSAGTVIVEAGARSGARRTATDAEGLGRALMAVPGQVTSAMSVGCHALLREGAICVTSVGDVIEAVEPLRLDQLRPEPRGPERARDGLDELTARVLDAVPARSEVGLDSIARVAAVTGAQARRAISRLERDGFVERSTTGIRLAARRA